MFETPRGAVAVRLMDALGLLDIVLPELTPARTIDQPASHHFWDVKAISSTTPHGRSIQCHSVAPCSTAVPTSRSP